MVRRVRAALPHAPLYQMYLQTEATARIPYMPAEDFKQHTGSVGKPIEGVLRDELGWGGAQAGSRCTTYPLTT
jgi:hypothetical protein